MFHDWNILDLGHPDTISLSMWAEWTEMRITEKNAASPKIMLIPGRQQEAAVESAEERAPDKPWYN